jgi:hypothetical protein
LELGCLELHEIRRRNERDDALEQRTCRREKKRDMIVAIHHGYRRAAVSQLWFALGYCRLAFACSKNGHSFAHFENERFPNLGIFSADVHAATFRPQFSFFSADSHFGCFIFLFLRDRLKVTGEMEKLTSDRKMIEKRGRVLVIWEYPEFSITGPPER